jgi:hypothetical protein
LLLTQSLFGSKNCITEVLITMRNVKSAGISGIKKRQYMKGKIDELATNSKKRTLQTCIEE